MSRRRRRDRAALLAIRRRAPRDVAALLMLGQLFPALVAASLGRAAGHDLAALSTAHTNVLSLSCGACGYTVVGHAPLPLGACFGFFAVHGRRHRDREPGEVAIVLAEEPHRPRTMPADQVRAFTEAAGAYDAAAGADAFRRAHAFMRGYRASPIDFYNGAPPVPPELVPPDRKPN